MDKFISEINRLRAALAQAETDLRALSTYRKDAHDHDLDMGYERRDFGDEDWDSMEKLAARCANDAGARLTQIPDLPETSYDMVVAQLNGIRAQYAGTVQLCCELLRWAPEEEIDRCEMAVKDWCVFSGWSYSRTPHTITLFSPNPHASKEETRP